ncbi:hypothetical protein P154DRAFT_78880 [Amniculicola lignicola CBS 123094]|uniref:Uncharacterized protein n=1 Tax=Amniculicola lignicola CBS 123094 TaxID=1392246 RepID=A0A6A5WP09_9PLEO|nr:hypothetical protein P154DRAFT_78880 [Amniculicola lignicola CBS 123094]
MTYHWHSFSSSWSLFPSLSPSPSPTPSPTPTLCFHRSRHRRKDQRDQASSAATCYRGLSRSNNRHRSNGVGFTSTSDPAASEALSFTSSFSQSLRLTQPYPALQMMPPPPNPARHRTLRERHAVNVPISSFDTGNTDAITQINRGTMKPGSEVPSSLTTTSHGASDDILIDPTLMQMAVSPPLAPTRSPGLKEEAERSAEARQVPTPPSTDIPTTAPQGPPTPTRNQVLPYYLPLFDAMSWGPKPTEGGSTILSPNITQTTENLWIHVLWKRPQIMESIRADVGRMSPDLLVSLGTLDILPTYWHLRMNVVLYLRYKGYQVDDSEMIKKVVDGRKIWNHFRKGSNEQGVGGDSQGVQKTEKRDEQTRSLV